VAHRPHHIIKMHNYAENATTFQAKLRQMLMPHLEMQINWWPHIFRATKTGVCRRGNVSSRQPKESDIRHPGRQALSLDTQWYQKIYFWLA